MISLMPGTWTPSSREQRGKDRVRSSSLKPGRLAPSPIPSLLFSLNRHLCCGFRVSMQVGVIKHSPVHGHQKLPAMQVSASLHLVFCHAAVPAGQTSHWTVAPPGFDQPCGPGLKSPSTLWWHPPCISSDWKVPPGQMWEMVLHPLLLAPASEAHIWGTEARTEGSGQRSGPPLGRHCAMGGVLVFIWQVRKSRPREGKDKLKVTEPIESGQDLNPSCRAPSQAAVPAQQVNHGLQACILQPGVQKTGNPHEGYQGLSLSTSPSA